MKKLLFLGLLLFLLPAKSSAQSWSSILSPTFGGGACTLVPSGTYAGCAIDWSTAGVGGIPSGSWTQSGSTITATSGDRTTTIQTALDGCGTNHFVLLGSGTFNVTNLLIHANCELRGQGANLTILSGQGSGNMIAMGQTTGSSGFAPNIANAVSISSGATAGSTSIVVASATGFSIGKLMVINELNASYVTIMGGPGGGTCTFCDGGLGWNGTRVRDQIVEISNVVGTTITFSPPLYTAYTLTPLATPFTAAAYSAGLKNVQLMNNNTGYFTSIGMSSCAYCWVQGVENNYADGDHAFVEFGFHDEIRDSYFSNAYSHGPGSTDAQVDFATFTSASLMENNIFERMHVSAMLEWGSAGNVISYNYATGNFDNGASNFVIQAMDYHGANPQFNLTEGNVWNSWIADSTWGGATWGTTFRDWSKGTTKICNPQSGRSTVSCSPSGVPGGVGVNGWFGFQAARGYSYDFPSLFFNNIGSVVGSAEQGTVASPVLVNTSNTLLANQAAIQWSSSRSYDSVAYGTTCGYSGSSDSGGYVQDSVRPCQTLLTHGLYNNNDGSTTWTGAITHTLPASFYLSGKPAWWNNAIPYPSIGPDITGGSGPGGHVSSTTGANPAMYCFFSIGGIDGGSGSPLTFNADSCYPTTPASPNVTMGGVATFGGSGIIQ